ncbi:hypothetical protein ACCO45_001898 [Purpureocillium lilacinum]|uniref:Uncharacterized protein n=1 Tax=Purpureocillium lilacinum TaxID=33203 RepID=A0ACC4E8D1_PURLI
MGGEVTGGRHQQAAPLEALGRALGRAPAHQLDVPGFIHCPDGTLSDGGPPRAAPAASHTPAIQPALGNSAALRRVESGPATNGSPWPEQPCTICRLSGPCLVAVLAVPVLSRDPFWHSRCTCGVSDPMGVLSRIPGRPGFLSFHHHRSPPRRRP